MKYLLGVLERLALGLCTPLMIVCDLLWVVILWFSVIALFFFLPPRRYNRATDWLIEHFPHDIWEAWLDRLVDQ